MAPFLVGFDGFIDTLYRAVHTRLNRVEYSSFTTLADFGSFLQSSSMKSCNVESIRLSSTLGGNAPLLALGLSSLAHSVHLVGCLGYPTLHPLFQERAELFSSLSSIGEAGTTAAYEFQDGKLLMGCMNDVLSVDLKTAKTRCHKLEERVHQSDFLITVNWTMCPLVEEFWRWLDSLPVHLLKSKQLFVDLADPKKRSKEELIQAIHTLLSLSKKMVCHLGLNVSEASLLMKALSLPDKATNLERAQELASSCPGINIYIHTAKEAVGMTIDNEFERIDTLYTPTPLRLTGAGDMFNAGLLSALHDGLSLKGQLQRAVQTSSHWVKTGYPLTKASL